MQFIRR